VKPSLLQVIVEVQKEITRDIVPGCAYSSRSLYGIIALAGTLVAVSRHSVHHIEDEINVTSAGNRVGCICLDIQVLQFFKRIMGTSLSVVQKKNS
jgi:hypothetical protein